MLEYALKLAARGWQVFPCHSFKDGRCTCGQSDCHSPAKHPRVKHGVKVATSDPAQIRQWSGLWTEANIAVACGPASGVWVLDIDGEPGRYSLDDLELEHGVIEASVVSRTGSGGKQLFFRHPDRTKIPNHAGRLAPGLDTRGEGGYVIVPPSTHRCGHYEWLSAPDVELEPAPAWLVRLVASEAAHEKTLSVVTAINPGARAEAALRYEIERVLATNEGGRNVALNKAAFKIGRFVADRSLDKARVISEFVEAGMQTGLSEAESEKAVRSGVNGGIKGVGGMKPPYKGGTPEQREQKEEQEPYWENEIMLNKEGMPAKREHNLELVFTRHPKLKGALAYNARDQRVEWIKAPPWDRTRKLGPYLDSDTRPALAWLERFGFPSFPASALQGWVYTVAQQHTFDPVEQYLSALQWDGKKRLDGWLSRAAGAPETRYHHAVGRAWMIGAVARTLAPGCKVDNMLLLEGEQGIGKSQMLAALAVRQEWFSDCMPNIDNKDAVQHMFGPWIVEIAELAGMKWATVEKIKAFISTQVDRVRLPYAASEVFVPRRAVLAGSTNSSEWNKDPTGARRFWPVECNGIVDVDWVASHRDQLWAEAVVAFKNGEPWWLSAEAEALATTEQRLRASRGRFDDELDEMLEGWLTPIGVNEILLKLGLEKPFAKSDQMSVADWLRRNGWEKRLHGKSRIRVWFP